MANAPLDQNSRQGLIALSNANDGTLVQLWADPVTHRLLTDSATAITVYTETPSGTIDGVNKAFTTVHTIGTVFGLYLNGQYQHPTADYTTSSNTITFVTAPNAAFSGLPFTIVYM